MNYYGYELIRESDLTHHGIKGQKWGVRRFQNDDGSLTSRGQVRYAKKEYKKAVKDYNKAQWKHGFGMDMVKNRGLIDEKKKNVDSAYDNLVDAKISRAKAKGGDRGELKEYKRQMWTHGLPGSAADMRTGGAGSRMYDRMIAKKGQEYADRVAKSTRNTAIAAMAGSLAVTVGATAVQAYLLNH